MLEGPHDWRDVITLLTSTDDLLRRLYQTHKPSGTKVLSNSALMFAEYTHSSTPQEIRVSEQEARQALIHQLQQPPHKFLFTIETPTHYHHNFQNKPSTEGMSGRIDVTLYRPDCSRSRMRAYNIELKSSLKLHLNQKNRNASNKSADHIRKDFFKLMMEDTHGVFFNVSEPESGVKDIDGAIEAMRGIFDQTQKDKFDEGSFEPKAKEILIYVSVLDDKSRVESSRYFIMGRESSNPRKYSCVAPSLPSARPVPGLGFAL